MSLFLKLLRAPWPVHIICAAVLVWLSFGIAENTRTLNLALEAAIAGAPPAQVAIDDLVAARPDDPVGEVNVLAKINTEMNTHVIVQKRRSSDRETYMYFIVPTGAAKDDRNVLAAIELTEQQRDAIAVQWAAAATSGEDAGIVVPIAGRRSGSDENAREVIAKNGWTALPGFMMIEPFSGSREAALRELISDPDDARDLLLVIAGLFALVGGVRFYTSRRRKHAPAFSPQGVVPPARPVAQPRAIHSFTSDPAQAQVMRPAQPGADGDTPIDRLRRRAAAEASQQAAELAEQASRRPSGPVRSVPMMSDKVKAISRFPAFTWLGGLALYAAIYGISKWSGTLAPQQMNSLPSGPESAQTLKMVMAWGVLGPILAGGAIWLVARNRRRANEDALGHALVDGAALDAAMRQVPLHRKLPLVGKLLIAGGTWYAFHQLDAFADAYGIALSGRAEAMLAIAGPLLAVLAVGSHVWLRLTGQFVTRAKMLDRLALELATQALLTTPAGTKPTAAARAPMSGFGLSTKHSAVLPSMQNSGQSQTWPARQGPSPFRR